MSVFNQHNTEWKTKQGSLFMGEAPALHDTINVRFPGIAALALKQVSQRWVFDEFNHEQSRIDLLTCPPATYKVMLMNLAYQWEADSIASRAIAPLFAPFVTNSELWEALMENTNMEITHAKTYSEIVRQCVADPAEVFSMVMENEQTLKRAETVGRVFEDLAAEAADTILEGPGSRSYSKVMMAVVALYALERIQFMASFAATFAIVEQGYFQSIGKAVQKIMLDELVCHAALDKEILKIEISEEPGRQWLRHNRDKVKKILDEVVAQEYSFGDYLFSDGRNIVGYNNSLCREWVNYNAQPVYDDLGIEAPFQRPTRNPLPWMDNWIDIDKTQNAMQEADGNNYALNVVKDDLGDEELDF